MMRFGVDAAMRPCPASWRSLTGKMWIRRNRHKSGYNFGEKPYEIDRCDLGARMA